MVLWCRFQKINHQQRFSARRYFAMIDVVPQGVIFKLVLRFYKQISHKVCDLETCDSQILI